MKFPNSCVVDAMPHITAEHGDIQKLELVSIQAFHLEQEKS